jgi:hypothetical protein
MVKFTIVPALAAGLWLGGCAVQVENAKPAQELERHSRPPGSVYAGWRVFEDKCAGCHGHDAVGGVAGVPDLVARVRGLGPRQFVDVLLTRYEWTVPPSRPVPSTPEREAFIDDILQRRKGALTMPERKGEPRVQAHMVDLYAYLSARAEGTQGPGRPAMP